MFVRAIRSVMPVARRSANIHGRQQELDAMIEAARRGTARCVTVTGIMGIGKTRLLEEARRRLVVEGVSARFVDTPATTRSGSRERGSSSLVLVSASEVATGALGEREIALGRLAIPGEGDSVGAIRRSPAVLLLAEAAKLEMDLLAAAEIHSLARIAIASDGHPAVLEQLAGWLWLLSPGDVAAAVDAGSLAYIPRGLDLRLKRRLRGLGAREREVLLALAETSAPFDLGAARSAVQPVRRAELPSTLAKLVAAGWLLRVGRPEAPRLSLLAPLRIVLRGRGRGRSRQRLTAHYAGRARAILDHAVADRVKVAELLDARDEVVASWEDAHARKDPAELALAAALASIATSGDRAVARHAARIRASIRAHPHAARRARLEIACGDALWFAGDVRAADRCFAAAVRRAHSVRDATTEAFGWIRRATLGPELARLDVARRQLARARILAATSDEPLVVVLAVGIEGFLHRAAGDVSSALASFDEQVVRARRIGDVFYAATGEASAADCHLVRGEYALGRARYERASRAVKQLDPAWARTLEGYMGLAAWGVGDCAEAVSKCHRAMRGIVGPRFRAVFSAARAGALSELGEVTRATTALARAEEIAASQADMAREAIHAATLLVTLASARDGASRRAATTRIRVYLGARGPALSEDDRPFVRALERATTETAPRRAASIPDGVLDSRPRLARVLRVLEDAATRGEVVSSKELFGAAWPEQGDVEAATADARVRKAISLLRALGLRGAIVTSERGYALRLS